jgi:hypothetical protein
MEATIMDHKGVRLAATAYAVGSVLWIALIVVLTAVWGVDPPPGSTAFYAVEACFVIIQLLLLFGFFGVLWSEGIGRGVFGKVAFGVGVLGHIAFVAAEMHSLMIGSTSDLLAAGALLSALGFVLTGIAVLLAKRWAGWARWVPLLTGIYPILVMFPFIAISGEPNGYAIAGWGVLRLALAFAIRAQASAPVATPGGLEVSQRGV